MADETTRKCLKALILLSFLAILSGIIGILALSLTWNLDFSSHRYSSLAYAGLSSVIGIWNLVLHIMHFQDIWRTWLKGLRIFITAGIIFCSINAISFLVFLIVAVVEHDSMDPNSFFVTAIWCAWASLWSALLIYYAKKYRSEYADLTALLDF